MPAIANRVAPSTEVGRGDASARHSASVAGGVGLGPALAHAATALETATAVTARDQRVRRRGETSLVIGERLLIPGLRGTRRFSR
jgi:hypothetical protein